MFDICSLFQTPHNNVAYHIFDLQTTQEESSVFNMVVSGLNLLLIFFVLAAGLPHCDPANWADFAPMGARGVFSGASVVFFSFIGFDTASIV